MNPLSILKDAIKEVPAVRYALGVAGVAAAVAIVSGYIHDSRVAVLGTLLMFGLMFVLVVFSWFAKTAGPDIRPLALTLAWSFVVLTIATSAFIFTGYFFSWPRTLEAYVATAAPSATPEQTPVPAAFPPASPKPSEPPPKSSPTPDAKPTRTQPVPPIAESNSNVSQPPQVMTIKELDLDIKVTGTLNNGTIRDMTGFAAVNVELIASEKHFSQHGTSVKFSDVPCGDEVEIKVSAPTFQKYHDFRRHLDCNAPKVKWTYEAKIYGGQ